MLYYSYLVQGSDSREHRAIQHRGRYRVSGPSGGVVGHNLLSALSEVLDAKAEVFVDLACRRREAERVHNACN